MTPPKTKHQHNQDSFQSHKLKWIQKVKPRIIMVLTEFGHWARDKRSLSGTQGAFEHLPRLVSKIIVCLWTSWKVLNIQAILSSIQCLKRLRKVTSIAQVWDERKESEMKFKETAVTVVTDTNQITFLTLNSLSPPL